MEYYNSGTESCDVEIEFISLVKEVLLSLVPLRNQLFDAFLDLLVLVYLNAISLRFYIVRALSS